MVIAVTEIYMVYNILYSTDCALPVPVFQEKLQMLIFTHFTT